MWQQFFAGIKNLILLQEQTDQNTAKIKEMQSELTALTSAVQQLNLRGAWQQARRSA